jgi:hypothetical protein
LTRQQQSCLEAGYLYKELAARYRRAEDRLKGAEAMGKLSQQKKAELRQIAELTLDATLAAEQKLSKLAARSKTT